MLLNNFLHLFLESAPWLLLGLFLAGMLKMFVPMEWMQRQLGGHGFKATAKAALLGAPLPLCSCGVIPAAIGLRRSGASKAATTSFLVSTPETGVDSVTVSYVLLGPFMAIVRPIAAIVSAIVAGLLVGRDEDEVDTKVSSNTSSNATSTGNKSSAKAPISVSDTQGSISFKPLTSSGSMLMTPMGSKMAAPMVSMKPIDKAVSSCCASEKVNIAPQTDSCCSTGVAGDSLIAKATAAKVVTDNKVCDEAVVDKAASCCSVATASESATKSAAQSSDCCQDVSTAPKSSSCASAKQEAKPASVLERIWGGLMYGANDLVRDTAIWLLIGLFFAALVQTYVPADFLAQWGNGILAMLVMVLVSIPMYICATASTPIAAGLLLAGVSPGAVLVFMMAGPATNIATLGVVSKELGRRALFSYLTGVIGVAVLAGMLVNYLVATFGFEVAPQIGEEHAMLPDWLVASSGLLLAFLMGRVLWQKLPKRQKASSCCSG